MNTNTLAAGVIGFLLGGLVVSTAAWMEEGDPAPAKHGSAVHGLASPTWHPVALPAVAAGVSR